MDELTTFGPFCNVKGRPKKCRIIHERFRDIVSKNTLRTNGKFRVDFTILMGALTTLNVSQFLLGHLALTVQFPDSKI